MGDFVAECQAYVDDVLKTTSLLKYVTHEAAEASCLQYEQHLQDAQDKAEELAARTRQLVHEYNETQEAWQGLQDELVELQEQRRQLMQQLEQLKAALQEEVSTAEELRPKKRKLEAEVQDAEATAEEKLARVHKEIQRYEECLGLRFESIRGERELKLHFTCIDPQEPDRIFTVGVNILSTSMPQYEVTRCEPAIDTLSKLLADLNNSGDFGAFARAVRSEFVASCAVDA